MSQADLTINELKLHILLKLVKLYLTEFWQYWDQLAIACANNDINTMQGTCVVHPAMNQYSLWIQEVKTWLKLMIMTKRMIKLIILHKIGHQDLLLTLLLD